mmetsp:Transcript_21506/g.46731  ORF Transcript_21506/g.46731 Transcript_21506/m.46731 type:complete len:400 (-) Transcript_21506:261-1460(-)
MTAAILTTLSSIVLFTCLPHEASSFSAAPRSALKLQPSSHHHRSRSILHSTNSDDDVNGQLTTRRSLLQQGLLATAAATATLATNNVLPANAATLGTLPEFSDANAILQSLTIDVTDKQQYDETIAFFTTGFDGMKLLRQQNGGDTGGILVKSAWLGFGPETLSIPSDFELPVSSLSQYGGHAAIHLRYDPQTTDILYKRSGGEFNNEAAPGDNIAYLQIGVPQYRISQMVKNGGNVVDAYGWVNVVSPAGLPVRAIVGVRADPMMFLAVNCNDVVKSEEFYAKLGFARQEFPYARLNEGQGQFEPPQPPKSVYLAPSTNSMGILLLQNKKKRKSGGVTPNPVLRSLNVVYAPPDGESGTTGDGDLDPQLMDPSSVPVTFISQDYFEKEIEKAAIPGRA